MDPITRFDPSPRRPGWWLLLGLVATVMAWAPAREADAKPEWVGAGSRVPNNPVYTCFACHLPPFAIGCAPVSNCNAFGLAFKDNGSVWSATLAAADSDADGSPDGWELQDPAGTWALGTPDPGIAALVANPGDATSAPPRISIAPLTIEHSELPGQNLMESFTVQNSGGNCAGNPSGLCSLAFQVASDMTWVSPDPLAGGPLNPLDSAPIDLLFTTDGLADGMYTGSVSVGADGVMPQQLAVTLFVPEPPGLPLRATALLSLGLVARRARRAAAGRAWLARTT